MKLQGVIKEIQGLRAIAIISVLLYHLWPSYIPGGFIGVDIFFVISGYLISNILIRDLVENGRVNYIKFYSRRIRRLAPAAGSVIVFVILFYSLFSPLQYAKIFDESISSVLFFQNWTLAFAAVDYLDAENAPGPFQHFWSLSVEEQYYLFWPIIIVILGVLIRRKSQSIGGRTIRNCIIFITACSFVFSIYQSHTDQSFAYFNFFTRIWELGLGSILATVKIRDDLSQNTMRMIGFGGLGAIVLGFTFIDKADAFPGYIAALPTVGCLLLLVYAHNKRKSFLISLLLNNRIAQYIGDISYSLYLWHWPLIVMIIGIGEGQLVLQIAVLLLSVVVATFSKKYIEDAFRSTKGMKSFWLIVTFSIVLPVILTVLYANHIFQEKDELSQGFSNSLDMGHLLGVVRVDVPEIYRKKCHVTQTSDEIIECVSGDPRGNGGIMLVGDSHAAQWYSSVKKIAEENDYVVHSMSKSACPMGLSEVMLNGEFYESCLKWNKNVVKYINAVKPKVLFISQSVNHKTVSEDEDQSNQEAMAESVNRFLDAVSDSVTEIVLIKDTPHMKENIPECLSQNTGQYYRCHKDRDEIIDDSKNDPLKIVSDKRKLPIMDMTHAICDRDICPAFDEKGIIWRDAHQLTASYVERIYPKFLVELELRLKSDQEYFDFSHSTVPSMVTTGEIELDENELKSIKKDLADAYDEECYSTGDDVDVKICSYGPETGKKLLLLGDSHAMQWLPALQEIGVKNNFHIISINKSACPVGSLLVNKQRSDVVFDACAKWNENVLSYIKKREFDALIVTQMRQYTIQGAKTVQISAQKIGNDLAQYFDHFTSQDVPVVFIRDTPWMTEDIPTCLEKNSTNPQLCNFDRSVVLDDQEDPDPLQIASEKNEQVSLLDMSDVLCDDKKCASVDVGGIRYRDDHHLSASFSYRLASPLEQKLMPLLEL